MPTTFPLTPIDEFEHGPPIDACQSVWKTRHMATLELTAFGSTCCATPAPTVLGASQAEELAALLKAVADPGRLRLLSLVARGANGETCICDLTGPVGLSQPTVSHHMKILVEAGLLTREQRGKWAYYRLVPDAAEKLAAAFLSTLQP
jgi:ArsR family transcriptional regulator, arsenate/arsenite/antimonite-responsive transcriptional repressor